MSAKLAGSTTGIWEKYLMALDELTDRLERIVHALAEAGVAYGLVGGRAVALWVATKDPTAVRTTRDVDILLRREDLPRARAVAASVALDYFELLGVGMFLERSNPHPRKGVHVVWSGEKVRPEYPLASPTVEECQELEPGVRVVSLAGLVCMSKHHTRATISSTMLGSHRRGASRFLTTVARTPLYRWYNSTQAPASPDTQRSTSARSCRRSGQKAVASREGEAFEFAATVPFS